MNGEKTAAVILAAGRSSRMGELKPLLKMGDRTILECAVSLFRQAGLKDVRVVAGYGRNRLEPVIKRAGASMVVNPDHDRGMFSSVLVGLESLGPGTGAVFFLPVDAPLVSPATVEELSRRRHDAPDRILVPSFQGRGGHPVLIPARFFDFVRRWRGEDGLRGALRCLADQRVLVDVPDRNVVFDVDTPEDYHELERRCSGSASGPDARDHLSRGMKR